MKRKNFFLKFLTTFIALVLIILPSISSPTQASADITDTGTWSKVADMPIYAERPAGILLQNGKVFVVGCGYHIATSPYCIQIYNPKYNSWKIIENPIEFDSNYVSETSVKKPYATTMLDDGRILITSKARINNNGYIDSFGVLYNPELNFEEQWATAGNPGYRYLYGHTATRLSNGNVLVAGGHPFIDGGNTNSTEIYSPTDNSWLSLSSMKNSRNHHTATLLQDGNVLITGGINYGEGSNTEIYDVNSGKWRDTSYLEIDRYGHTATLLPNGNVLVTGGRDYSNWPNESALSNAEIYEPATEQWTTVGNMSTGRYFHTATLLQDGRVLVIGGTKIEKDENNNEKYIPLNNAEIYDPNTGAWSTVENNMNTPHTEHVATLLPDGRIFIAGGNELSENGREGAWGNSTEIFNPDGTPPIFSPYPEACSVTTSPNTQTLSAGETTTISAEVTTGLGNATIKRMGFGSNDTSIATVDPEETTDSPYETTVTGVAEGNTAIRAAAELSDGRTCESSEDTATDVSVSAPTPTPSCTPSPSGLNTCELQKGDILLSHSDNVTAFAEALLFNGYWTHAGIYNGDGTITESYPDTPAETPGVVVRPQSESLFWHNDVTDWAVLRVNSLDTAQRNEAINFAKDQEGDLYNYIFFDKLTETKFYCSQLVWRAFEKQGVDLDSNNSGFSKHVLNWKTPFGLLGAAAIYASVPPDDIYFSSEAANILEKQLPEGSSRWVFRILSPAKLLVTDPQGRQTGYLSTTESAIQQIPGTLYGGIDADPQFVTIKGQIDSNWKFQIIGTGEGEYTFLGEDVNKNKHTVISAPGDIVPGEIVNYQLSRMIDSEDPILVQIVNMDIKPGSEVAPINLKSKGGIPIAVYSSDSFNAATINPVTVKFGPGAAIVDSKHWHIEDVNKDGKADMMFQFDAQSTGIQASDTQACLTGMTTNNINFQRCNPIRVVGI